MGPTGCGKSTLISLIPRFMDVSRGAILIDGVDVRKYDLNTLRGIVGMSMQDVFLFSETIDANISYGDPEMPEERVIECAKDADADGFIRRTPEGYGRSSVNAASVCPAGRSSALHWRAHWPTTRRS